MRTVESILKQIKKKSRKKNKEGMARFGINAADAYGTSVWELRRIAKTIPKSRRLAEDLWDSKVHEARILACLIDEPDKVTESQMDKWAGDFDSWDLCDQCCLNLWDKTEFAYKKAKEWVKSEQEFVRRAGFVMMAVLAVHDKKVPDTSFEQFFPLIKKYSTDERNFVKKAVNWALRQIGKRSKALNKKAVNVAEQIKKLNTPTSKWIANDALRELKSRRVLNRLA
ncbi:MAG TPA: DNA alkylation repair protein [Candidatus Woesearchaeota archaeon]|nr:DNA alkylation repair protein [Candidatus Woesearchaeota archaeon]